MKLFAAITNFSLAAFNVGLGVWNLCAGRPVGAFNIAAGVFCFGLGLFVSLK